MNIIYAITKFCTLINLVAFIQTITQILFPKAQMGLEYTITMIYNILDILSSTILETYPNYKSLQLWLIKFSSITHDPHNLKTLLRSLYKRRQPHQTFLQQKKLELYPHANIGFHTYGPIFLQSSHLHMSHFLLTPNK
jgi:hypothetical protein